MGEIKAGNVGILCIKDMSRIGRNYLQVGFYTEILFPDKGVRFIAVNNNIDSANPVENEFTPFLNIMNEWYAKDTSKKIKAVFRNRMENGLRCSGAIPYGYKRIPGDKQTLYVDEEAASVVRRIFKMAAEGIPVRTIADTLTADKVLIPSAYEEQHDELQSRHHRYHDPYLWTATTIGYILERQEYLGHTVLGKTICENFKTKKRRKADPEELLVFPYTHEAIVDQDIWERANRLRKRSPKRKKDGTYSHRLSGLLFCADCGARMGYISPESIHRKDGRVYDSDSAFQCGSYRSLYDECTSHYIKTSAIETVIQNLYENQIKGIMPERQVQRLMKQYDKEQLQLESRISELEMPEQENAPKKASIKRFITLVKKYQDIRELTDSMVFEFIEKVEIHAPTGGRTRYRNQQIDVYFNFIGQFQSPGDAMTEEERIARIDEEYAAKKNKKAKRSGMTQNRGLQILGKGRRLIRKQRQNMRNSWRDAGKPAGDTGRPRRPGWKQTRNTRHSRKRNG